MKTPPGSLPAPTRRRYLYHIARLAAAAALTLQIANVHAANAQAPNVERAKQLIRKSQAGEALTPEQQAFLNHVREDVRRRRQTGQAPGAPQPRPSPDQRQGAAAGNLPPTYGSCEWVDPDRTAPEFTQYRTFPSKTINGDVSYLVYLPPDYERQPAARYPVLYELPASGGTPARDAAEIVRRVNGAIRSGRIAPMIVIGVNGLRGNTMYCDSRDGKWPLESVIINDLRPWFFSGGA